MSSRVCWLLLVVLVASVDARFYRYPNASLPSGRDWMAAARAANKIYFVGGSSDSLLWPSATSTLTDAAVRFSVESMRSQDYLVNAPVLETVRCGAAGTSNGSHAFFAGGLVGRPSVYTYTDGLLTYSATTRISPRQLAGVERGFASAVTIQTPFNTISVSLFAGGHDDDVFHNDVDVLDHKTDTITLARLSVARKDAAAGSVNHYAVFAGGEAFCDASMRSFCSQDAVDVFDGMTMRFLAPIAAKLSSKRSLLGVGTLDSRIYFAGGEQRTLSDANAVNAFSDAIDYFDAGSMSMGVLTTRLSVARSRIAAAVVAGTLLLVGGLGSTIEAARAIDSFDGNSWRTLASLDATTPLVNARAVAFGGIAVFAGGSTHSRTANINPTHILIYEPDTPTPTPTPSALPPCASLNDCNTCLSSFLISCSWCNNACQPFTQGCVSNCSGTAVSTSTLTSVESTTKMTTMRDDATPSPTPDDFESRLTNGTPLPSTEPPTTPMTTTDGLMKSGVATSSGNASIYGAVCGCIALLALVSVAIYCVVRGKRQHRPNSPQAQASTGAAQQQHKDGVGTPYSLQAAVDPSVEPSSNYSQLSHEQFDYSHPDASFVDSSVLEEEARLRGAVNFNSVVILN